MKALIIEGCWEFEEDEASDKDLVAAALVTVDEVEVHIYPHGSDQEVRVAFTREEFAEIVKLVDSVPPAEAVAKDGGN